MLFAFARPFWCMCFVCGLLCDGAWFACLCVYCVVVVCCLCFVTSVLVVMYDVVLYVFLVCGV